MLKVKASPRLFKLDSKGNVRVWWVDVLQEGEQGFLTTSHGLLDGAITSTKPQPVSPTNVGRANERNSIKQAEFEYDALIQKKLRERYTADPSGKLEFPQPKAMLAHEWKKYADKVFKIDSGIVYQQPKLDGIRCLVNRNGMWTRGGKLIVSCPHLEEPTQKLLDYLPDGTFLDGELYNHELKNDFQGLVSLIRKQKVTKESLEITKKKVQYHIYDTSGTEEFFKRYGNVMAVSAGLDMGMVKFVQSKAVSNLAEINNNHLEFLREGYEGSIIRWGLEGYEEKRSKHLLKMKDFDSEELTVVRVEEGQGDWQGAVKRFVLSKDGNHFGAGVRGEREVLADMWKNKETPDWATVRYFGLTDDGIPRFPVVIDWGIDERTD